MNERIENALYATLHPIKSITTKRKQIAVGIELSSPPPGSTIEEFPELGLKEAVKLLYPKVQKGDVPLSAWSPEDQKRLKDGKLPKGVPEHNNV